MILTFGSLANSTPYLGGILLIIVLAWLGAARSLDSQFSPLVKEQLEKEKRMKEKIDETVFEMSKEVNATENGSTVAPTASDVSANGSALKQETTIGSESSSGSSTSQIQ